MKAGDLCEITVNNCNVREDFSLGFREIGILLKTHFRTDYVIFLEEVQPDGPNDWAKCLTCFGVGWVPFEFMKKVET